jgi:hypothetical protein
MGTPAQALASAAAVRNACNGVTTGAAADLVQALVKAAAPLGDRAYFNRFSQCTKICVLAGISSPSYDTTSGTLASMHTAMGSAISALSTALGAAAPFVLEAAAASNNDLDVQFASIVTNGTAASSAAIDALIAEATTLIEYIVAVGAGP